MQPPGLIIPLLTAQTFPLLIAPPQPRLAHFKGEYGKGRAGKIPQHAYHHHRPQNQPQPNRAHADCCRLVRCLLQAIPRAEPKQKGRETTSIGLKRKAAARCPCSSWCSRAQGAAPGTKQAGGLVEEADRVEMILPRVEAEQHEARDRGEQGTQGQDSRGARWGSR